MIELADFEDQSLDIEAKHTKYKRKRDLHAT
jgi:hypothetical protein